MKIAVSVHLYHTDMWDDIQKYLDNLKYPYKLYVNIPLNETNGLPDDFDWKEYLETYEDLKKGLKHNEPSVTQHYMRYGKKEKRFFKKNHYELNQKIRSYQNNSEVFYTLNVGMDIGGFLQTYKIIESDTDLILKIHTKKCLGSFENTSFDVQRMGFEKAKEYGVKWFRDLMDGVIESPEKVDKIINEFKINNKCGMVGYQKYNNYKKNSGHIQRLFEYFSFSVNLLESFFVGGTIFWVRKDVLDKYLSHERIDHIIKLLNPGYSHEPSFAHAMERMFAYFVYDQQKELMVIS